MYLNKKSVRTSLKASINDSRDEIVISGISGRFPRSRNMREFADNLYNKVDLVDDSEERWRHTNPMIPKRSGKISGIEKFDRFFFSVHHRQANAMDPQCRMLLEHSYEAVLDAGINPNALRGSRTGVFIACGTCESDETFIYGKSIKDSFGVTGVSRTMLANRVSFALDLSGPSFTLDSACSASVTALDCAFNAMRLGECDAAIVGGSNLLLHPSVTKQFVKLGILSHDGKSRSFDKDATGFVRAEAVCVILLQKAADTKRIYANVVYTKTNNDGFKTEAITHPSSKMQTRLLREFYDDLKLDPSEIGFVEAHCTGTNIGDPEECSTLDTIFCDGKRGLPLPVGSVKSNIGHAEDASGICSIAKVLIAFEHNKIPPNLHYTSANPDIPALMEGRLEVVTEAREVPGPYIAVNSFGFGGSNAHALFKGNDKVKVNHGIPTDDLPRLVVWCGRTEEAVVAILDSVTNRPLDAEYVGLLQNTQTSTSSANVYRGYGIFSQTGTDENAKLIKKNVQNFGGEKRPVVWVYSGIGSQWCGMASDLMKIPVFSAAIEKCHEVLASRQINLKKIITSSDPAMFDNILHSLVGIAAIQVGLTNVLVSLGLSFDYVVGHSAGEFACAYADGCFSTEETVLAAYLRGKACVETQLICGSMAAVGLGYKEARTLLIEGIEIACHNSADSCTIVGPARKISDFVAALKKQNIFAKEVHCSGVPFHSSYITEMGPKLLSGLNEMVKHPKKRSEKWISSSVPKAEWNNLAAQFSSGEYHTNNLLSPVLFEEALDLLPKDSIVIEIAPHALLQAILKRSLSDAINIGLVTRGNMENSVSLIEALGKLFVNGVDVDVAKLYPPIAFPVSRGTPMISPSVKWDHSEDFFVQNYEQSASTKREHLYKVGLYDHEYLAGHLIDGRLILPVTSYLFIVWDAFAVMTRVMLENCDVEFEGVKFLAPTFLTTDQEVELNVVIQKGTNRFEVNEGSNAIVTGYVRVSTTKLTDPTTSTKSACNLLLESDFYKEFRLRGYEFSGAFRSIAMTRADGLGGRVKWESNWITFIDSLIQMKIFAKDTRDLRLPAGIRKLVIKPQDHLTLVERNPNEDKTLEVFVSPKLDLMRCGGVEICGIGLQPILSRRKPAGDLILETFEFLPHTEGPMLSRTNFARACVQLALENLQTAKFELVELDDGKEPLCGYFAKAFDDTPLVTGKLNYLTRKTIEIEKVSVQDCALTAFNKLTFIVKSEADANFLRTVSSLLRDGGFVVSREPTANKNLTLPDGYKQVAAIETEGDVILLLRYTKVKPEVPTQVVRVTSNCFGWVEELKRAIENGPTIVYSDDNSCGLLGLVYCLTKEPNGSNLTCVCIFDAQAPPFDIKNNFYRSQISKGLAINVLKNGQWGTYRHYLLQQDITNSPRIDHCVANCLTRGNLSSLTWLKGPLSTDTSDHNSIRVHYAALNFKDVMLATGQLVSDVSESGRLNQLCALGLEYSGVTQANKRVMGIAKSGALATHAEQDDVFAWDCPDSWSLEEAATVPVCYGTVYSAFFMSARVEKGRKILIHAGSGGVGLAAIHVAFAYGLEVFTTVSTDEKRKFLLNLFPQLKRENIGNSRDVTFEDLVKEKTNGEGVDYVLNSLTGDKLHASIRCLAKGGKFLEMGKFDLQKDTDIGLGHFLKEISFHAVTLFRNSHEENQVLKKIIQQDIERGIVKPLKSTVFVAQRIEDAFRHLGSGGHIGKVLLQIRADESDLATLPMRVEPRVYCSPKLSYIILGGLGGVGIELANWLVSRGCKKLVLCSRSGMTTPYQVYRIMIWESYGVQVSINKSDILTNSGCKQLILESTQMGSVGGIFNLAISLRSNFFSNQSGEMFAECLAPKQIATKHMDELSRVLCPDLQYFVVFSSSASSRGFPGISNYGMANSTMERIIEHRHSLGYPAIAIQFGRIGDVGVMAEKLVDAYGEEVGGTIQQKISSVIKELDLLMTSTNPIVASMVIAEKCNDITQNDSILDTIKKIMSIRDATSLSMEITLSALGMDSLMTIEIQQTLEREHDLKISSRELRTITLAELIKLTSKLVENESNQQPIDFFENAINRQPVVEENQRKIL